MNRMSFFGVVILLIVGCQGSDATSERKELSDAASEQKELSDASSKQKELSDASSEQKELSDAKRIVGTWKVVRMESAKTAAASAPGMEVTQIVFDGQFMEMQVRYEEMTLPVWGSYRLDPSTNPGSISTSSVHRGSYKGIYRFEDSRLMICFGEVKPTEFKIGKQQGEILFVLERLSDDHQTTIGKHAEVIRKREERAAESASASADQKPTAAIQLIAGPKGRIESIAFHPDGKQVAAARNVQTGPLKRAPGDVRIWEVATGEEQVVFKEHKTSIASLAFSPDGQRLVGGSHEEMTVYVWDAIDGEVIHKLTGNTDWINCVAFSPDGRWIAAGGKDVHLWEASTGKWHGVFQGTGQGRAAPRVRSIAFSSDSRRIAVAGPDKTGSPAVYIWDISAGKDPRRISGGMDTVAFGDKDSYVAAFGGRRIHFWDAASGESLRSFSADGWGAWGPKYELFAAIPFMSIQQRNAISIWEAKSGKRIAKLPSRPALVHSVTFSPDGNHLATGGGDWYRDSELIIWDVGKLITTGRE